MIITTIALIVLCSISNAFMDLSADGKMKRQSLNKEYSWRNKWKDQDPDNGEAFPLSSTVLVWLTDFWHLMQFIFHSCWQLAIALNIEGSVWLKIGAFVIIKIVFSLLFELIYKSNGKK